MIRAVNLLQPLGKERALAAIEEFLRVSAPFTEGKAREGLFVVLRTLFEVPTGQTEFPYEMKSTPGYMPPILAGSPYPEEPNDKRLLPHFPVAIEGDIPFYLVSIYEIGGVPDFPDSHVSYFRKFGKLRAKPLLPTARPVLARSVREVSALVFQGQAIRSSRSARTNSAWQPTDEALEHRRSSRAESVGSAF